jgi:predicted MPP superfamily phosphohydrolase
MEGDHRAATQAMAELRKALAPDCWGILGNHDPLEMVLDLERDGLPILLNETAEIRRGGDSLWIAGVDDPHYFQTHDLAGTRKKAPADAFVILLSHSPETYAEAAAHGFALQLSGHTHGGQICLPGGRHVVVPCKSPRRFIAGAWQHGSLQGYTSRGAGACGVAARWNCPPEITLHTLRRAKA